MAEAVFTDSNFDAEVLKSSVPVFVDFWAPWCGPCQMMGPIVDELAKIYPSDKLKIGKLNVDDNQTVAGTYQVMSIPTFLLFKNGAVADKLVGGVSRERLKEFIDKHLS
ncbi:MAG: thioredoxin [Candidatus Paceibacterota bacterium]|jgi:thioredoxin 1